MLVLRQPIPSGVELFVADSIEEALERASHPQAELLNLPFSQRPLCSQTLARVCEHAKGVRLLDLLNRMEESK